MKANVIKITALLIAALFLNSLVVTAQTAPTVPVPTVPTPTQPALTPPPAKLPTGSKAEMQLFAEGLVNKLYLSNWSGSASGKTSDEVDYTAGDIDTASMTAKVRAIKLDYRVDPTKPIDADITYGWRTPDMRNQFTLFVGHAQFTLVKNVLTGLWEVPVAALQIPIESLNWVPVQFFAIQGAQAVTTDNKGNVVSVYDFNSGNRVDQNNGFLILGSEFAGRPNTTIYVTRSNGDRLVYGGDGSLQPVVPVTATGFTPNITGERSLPDNTSNLVFQPGDKLVRIKFTNMVTGTLTFPAGMPASQMPTAVYYVDAAAYWANPEMKWTEISLRSPSSWVGTTGKLMVFRFDYPNTDPMPTNPGRG